MPTNPKKIGDADRRVIRFLYERWMAGVREFTEAEFKRFLNSTGRPERFHTAAAWLVHRKLVEPLTITECGGSADSQKKTRLAGWLILPELQDFWGSIEEEAESVGGQSNSVEMQAVGKGAEYHEVPVLSELQYLILETMKELAAMSADTRRTGEDIATACNGKQAEVNVFKPLLSDLTKRQLVQSKTGRGGGSWLTLDGVDIAERLLKNRKASASKQ